MSDGETSEERERELTDALVPESSKSTEMAAAVETEAEPETKPKRSKLQQLLYDYRTIGIVVLLSLSALTWLGFAAAFMFGFQVEGAAGTMGVVAAATAGWGVTKFIRIPLAVVLTPVVASLWHRVRGTKAPSKAD